MDLSKLKFHITSAINELDYVENLPDSPLKDSASYLYCISLLTIMRDLIVGDSKGLFIIKGDYNFVDGNKIRSYVKDNLYEIYINLDRYIKETLLSSEMEEHIKGSMENCILARELIE